MSTNELPQNAIEVEQAVTWVNAWRNSDMNLPKKGFFIPKVDVTEVMAEAGVSAVRTYLAIDPEDDNPDSMYHLLVVGIDNEGNDMLNPDLGQYVYDFTLPCPSTCSGTGVLR